MNPSWFAGRKIFGLSSLAAHGIGAAIGGVAGASLDNQNRFQGALVGAGLGLAGVSGAKLMSNYNTSLIKRLPGKGLAATVGITGLALGAGSVMAPEAYQRASIASPGQSGNYDQQIQYENYKYSLSDRVASMNVSGDLVFGLHNLRHG